MEGRPDSELAKLLDIKAGVDGWQIHKDGMRGIASRIQITPSNPYNSFTIRLARDSGTKTEYEKRKIAIETGRWMYPFLTIQAYAKSMSGPILSVGLAKTEDIVSFIKSGYHGTNRTTNATFAVCYWDNMVRHGFKVIVHDFTTVPA
jgi:hypothetical protein